MLTDKAIRAAKPRAKPYKLFDRDGLHALVHPSGGRWWRVRFFLHGKERLLSAGTYPDTSLAQARARCDDIRRMVAAGSDPAAERREAKAARVHTFLAVAEDWLGKQRFAPKTLKKARWIIGDLLKPLHTKPVAGIKPRDVLAVVRALEGRGKIETAHRTKQKAGQIMRFAVASGLAERDPTADLRGALTAVAPEHRPAITNPKRLGELLRAVDGYAGQFTTACALRLLPLVFTRPGELRNAEWREFQLTGREPLWTITAERTKQRRDHLVPLAPQVVAVLRELQQLTGDGRLLFPCLRTAARPISDATFGAALRRLGFAQTEVSAHGFRATARTLLDEELHVPPHLIEHQLAHAVRDPLGRAYNRTSHLPERRVMMQRWADYLDKLRAIPGKA